jgi:hypothetical protein
MEISLILEGRRTGLSCKDLSHTCDKLVIDLSLFINYVSTEGT